MKAVLSRGQRVAHAALNYNIPKSTLCERVKFERIKRGIFKNPKNKPYNVTFKRRKHAYTHEDLESAIDEVMNGGKFRRVSEKYGIPHNTLFENVKRKRLLENYQKTTAVQLKKE